MEPCQKDCGYAEGMVARPKAWWPSLMHGGLANDFLTMNSIAETQTQRDKDKKKEGENEMGGEKNKIRERANKVYKIKTNPISSNLHNSKSCFTSKICS